MPQNCLKYISLRSPQISFVRKDVILLCLALDWIFFIKYLEGFPADFFFFCKVNLLNQSFSCRNTEISINRPLRPLYSISDFLANVVGTYNS